MGCYESGVEGHLPQRADPPICECTLFAFSPESVAGHKTLKQKKLDLGELEHRC